MFRQQGAILRDLQTNVWDLYRFVLKKVPEDDTPVPKYVGAVIIVTNFILFNAFVGGSSD